MKSKEINSLLTYDVWKQLMMEEQPCDLQKTRTHLYQIDTCPFVVRGYSSKG